MKSINDAGEKAKLMFESSNADGWIKWFHSGIPDEPEWQRKIVRAIAALFGHCMECTALSGCYFKDDILRCPEHPRHTNCDCEKINTRAPRAVAYCDINKFTGYIFSDKYASNGKRDLFEQLGFTDQDSEFLKSEYERQAREKYISGNYRLGKIDSNGPRMNIEINFAHPDRGLVSFVSGWMIRPNGQITCNTPLGGLYEAI